MNTATRNQPIREAYNDVLSTRAIRSGTIRAEVANIARINVKTADRNVDKQSHDGDIEYVICVLGNGRARFSTGSLTTTLLGKMLCKKPAMP